MSDAILKQHKEVWEQKPILRILYTHWYRALAAWLQPGLTLEVGGGTGNLKEFAPNVFCTDVTRMPWLDAVADAQYLPFATTSLANIVLFDTLHHLENVRLFLDEALRVLRPRGRLIIMDPYISWWSWPIYHFFHSEPVDLGADPLQIQPSNRDRRPFDANQAVSTILFERSYGAFQNAYPQFKKLFEKKTDLFAYPLSGGFDHPSLLPDMLLKTLLRVESSLTFLNRLFAFRLLVVLEKQP